MKTETTFRQLQNIESAFQHIRLFSLIFILANCVICCYMIAKAKEIMVKAQNRIYILAYGKLLDAVSADRRDSLIVEVRDHVKSFHFFFYSLAPDEKANKNHITKALYLADETAKTEYENLNENGYYSNFISGNISQTIEPDSVQIDISSPPYYFKYFAKLKIERATSVTTRSLITEGYIRTLPMISDNNPHGFLIQRWKILENKDLTVEKK